MSKIQKSSELLWLLGVLFVALGVAVCSKADLGVSMIAAPAFVLSEALVGIWSGFRVGVVEYLIQGLLLLLLCLAVRRFNWRYLLSFAVAVLYGYTLDLFMWLLRDVSLDAVLLRWVMLIVGDLLVAFGVACFFATYLPLQVYELFVAELCAHFGWNIHKTKSAFDLSLLAVSVSLALLLFGDVGGFDWSTVGYASFHSIGMGTIVTTLINSPLISLMRRVVARFFDPAPRFGRVEAILGRQ